jgi:hypothetical protein
VEGTAPSLASIQWNEPGRSPAGGPTSHVDGDGPSFFPALAR